MFGSWKNVRIKTARRAIAAGRLDEAWRILTLPDVADDPQADTLADELVRPLLARARVHAQAGHYDAALRDLDLLAQLQRGEPERSQLRERYVHERDAQRTQRAAADRAAHEAAERLRAGRLESGRAHLANLPPTPRRDALADELDARVKRSGDLLAQAAQALAAGDTAAALRYWQEARDRHGRTTESDDLAQRLTATIRADLDDALRNGRLEQYDATLTHAATLRQALPLPFEEHDRIAGLLRDAVRHVEQRRYYELRHTLLRLRGMARDAAWVTDALAAAADALAAHERLVGSPLSWLSPQLSGYAAQAANAPATPAAHKHLSTEPPTLAAVDDPTAVQLDGRPLLLIVDGACSALLLSEDTIRIGRAGASGAIDVPLPADVQSHHADIHCGGDDCFIVARGPVRMNHTDVTRALLRHGVRVRLGRNGQLTYEKPSAKSETAVLVLPDRQRLPLDVSRVVLLRDTCLIGPQPSCHLRTREGESRVVLFTRRNRLYARLVGADERPAGPARPIVLGETQSLGDISLTVTNYDTGGRIIT